MLDRCSSQVRQAILSSATWGAVSPADLYPDTPNAILNSLLVDPVVTLCSGEDHINITEANARYNLELSMSCSVRVPWPDHVQALHMRRCFDI